MKRWFVPVILFAGFSIALNQVFERVLHFSFLDAAKDFVTHPGIGAALTVVGLLGGDVLLPVPSSLVMVMSGVLFGTLWGGLLSLAGSLAGNWFAFELMRRYGWRVCGRFVDEAEVKKVRPFFEKFGVAAIILSRPVPVLMETVSFAAGFLQMSRARFLAGSLLGTVPIAFIYARAGAASWQMSSLLPALVIIVCVPAVGWFLVRRREWH